MRKRTAARRSGNGGLPTEKKPYVVGVGAANIDQHWRSIESLNLRDSNPSHCTLSVGGVTRNICENTVRMGLSVTLLTRIGDDAFAEKIIKDSTAAGIDMSRAVRVPGETSSCYIAVLDDTGDLMIGLSDMHILREMPASFVEANAAFIGGASAVVCDGALPHAVTEAMFEAANGVPCFLDPVSIAYTRNMLPYAGRFFCIKPNRIQLGILSGLSVETDREIELAAEAVLRGGTERIAVSLGARGCYYADRSGKRFFRALPPLELMADATGAGDAFTAGMVYGTVTGLSAEDTVLYALAAGRIAAASPVTVSPEMSIERIRETIRTYV